MPQPSLKIDRARYVISVDEQRRIIRDGSILIENGRISRVGRADELAAAGADRVIGARHFVVTPGFVNGHMHISYAHPVRGIFPDDLGSPLKQVFALQMAMTEEEEYHTTLLALLELVRNGTVCLLDPGSTKFPDACLQAYEDAGVRVIMGEAVTDREAPFTLPRYAEVDCVARSGAAVTMCPVTAAKGARGATALGRMPELLARSVRVALGCDSPNNSNHLDPVRTMNMAAIQYKDARQDIRLVPAETALEMGTRLGAAALGLGDEIGAIEAGKRADLVLFDTRRPEWQALWNPVNNLIYNTDGRSVHTVVIDGRVVVDDYRQTFVDEARLFATVQEIGERLQARTGITRSEEHTSEL